MRQRQPGGNFHRFDDPDRDGAGSMGSVFCTFSEDLASAAPIGNLFQDVDPLEIFSQLLDVLAPALDL